MVCYFAYVSDYVCVLSILLGHFMPLLGSDSGEMKGVEEERSNKGPWLD